jgi:two-component system chemotaxis response regulator CheY
MTKRILVVDDSAAVRQSVSYVLDQAGYEVVQAADGIEGMKKLDGTMFHLIITDVNMPNMDGIELTGKVRETEDYRLTPIIVLTTESQNEKMNAGKEAGATGWIVKPFNSSKLLQVVKRLAGEP